MKIVRVGVVTLVSMLVVASASFAADAQSQCKRSILAGGTEYFEAVLDVTGRCERDHLRRATVPEEGCPTTDESTALFDLGTGISERIIAGCAFAVPRTTTCVLSAGDEAFDLVGGVFRPITTVEPDGRRRRCRDTLGAQAIRFAHRTIALLERCNDKALRAVPGYGPPGPACDGPTHVQTAIADAQARAERKIVSTCSGPDRTLGTGDDFDPQIDLGFPNTCAGAPYCTFAIDGLADLMACATCVAQAEVAQLARGLAALPIDAPTACELGIGTAFLSLLDDDLRDFAACEDRIFDGNGTGPCPDAETLTDLVSNQGRYTSRVTSACGAPEGPDPAIPFFLAQDLTNVLFPTHAEAVGSTLRRCKLEIARSATSSNGYARRKLRANRDCHTQLLCGQTSNPCPDQEAQNRIALGAQSHATNVGNRCAGFTPGDLGYGATCPSSGACGALPTTTIPELVTCLQCVADEVIDPATALAFAP